MEREEEGEEEEEQHSGLPPPPAANWYRPSGADNEEKSGPYRAKEVAGWLEARCVPLSAQVSSDDGASWQSIIDYSRPSLEEAKRRVAASRAAVARLEAEWALLQPLLESDELQLQQLQLAEKDLEACELRAVEVEEPAGPLDRKEVLAIDRRQRALIESKRFSAAALFRPLYFCEFGCRSAAPQLGPCELRGLPPVDCDDCTRLQQAGNEAGSVKMATVTGPLSLLAKGNPRKAYFNKTSVAEMCARLVRLLPVADRAVLADSTAHFFRPIFMPNHVELRPAATCERCGDGAGAVIDGALALLQHVLSDQHAANMVGSDSTLGWLAWWEGVLQRCALPDAAPFAALVYKRPNFLPAAWFRKPAPAKVVVVNPFSSGCQFDEPSQEAHRPEPEALPAAPLDRAQVMQIACATQAALLAVVGANVSALFNPSFFCPLAFRAAARGETAARGQPAATTPLHAKGRVCAAAREVRPKAALLTRCDDSAKQSHHCFGGGSLDASAALAELRCWLRSCLRHRVEAAIVEQLRERRHDFYHRFARLHCELCECTLDSPWALAEHLFLSSHHAERMVACGTGLSADGYKSWRKTFELYRIDSVVLRHVIRRTGRQLLIDEPIVREHSSGGPSAAAAAAADSASDAAEDEPNATTFFRPLALLRHTKRCLTPCADAEGVLNAMGTQAVLCGEAQRRLMDTVGASARQKAFSTKPLHCKMCGEGAPQMQSPYQFLAHVTSRAHISEALRDGGVVSAAVLFPCAVLLELAATSPMDLRRDEWGEQVCARVSARLGYDPSKAG